MRSNGWLAEFDAFAEAFFHDHEVPGGAVAVVRGDEVLLSRGYGLRDRERKLAASDLTRFGLASLTKSFTALTVLSLAAEGRLKLDDPVTRWLADFDYPGLRPEAPVRLRHLLSHTSGIPPLRALDFAIHPSQVGDPAELHNQRSYADAPPMQSYHDLLAYLRCGEGPLIADPGRVLSYSNDGYGLLGAVITEAAAVPYQQALRERVFVPLGMDGAGFAANGSDTAGGSLPVGDLTVPYTRIPSGEVIASPQWEEAPAHLATGFMKASARDLSRSLRYLMGAGGDRLAVPAADLASLFAPRVWAEPATRYGLGWMVRPDYHGTTLIRHGGSLKGVSSHQGIVPELGLGVAVLANLDDAQVKRLWLAAVNLALGLPAVTPPYTVPAGIRGPDDAVVGSYASGEPWGRFEVRREQGALRAYTGEEGEPAGRLAWLDESVFVLDTDAGAWGGGRVQRDASGAVYVVQQGMRWYARERVPLRSTA